MGIMDLRTKKSLSEDGMGDNNKKSCTDCQTTKTPLWRGGPAGPKSLCNACGIRYRKKRREMLSLDKGFEKKDRKKKKKERSLSDSSQSSSVVTTNDDGSGDKKTDSAKVNGPSETVKMSLFAVGSDLLLQRSLSSSSSTITFSTSLSGVVKKQRCQRRRRLGEVEQAAINLMALSCDSVFA